MLDRMVAQRWLRAGTVVVLGLAGWANLCAAQDKPAEQPKAKDIIDAAKDAGNFKTFLKLVDTAGLTETLRGKGPYTVFAPTDEAFNKVGKETVDSWQKPENKAKLQKILKYHIVSGKHSGSSIEGMKSCKTMCDQECTISVKDGALMIDKAKVTKTDLPASNGTIHVIDTVLMPKD